MFLGGCAGSTSGGFKIIRVICLVKSLPHAVEQSYRPNVVRPLLIGGVPLDKETGRHMMMHFVVLTTVFSILTMFLWIFVGKEMGVANYPLPAPDFYAN